MAGFPRHGTTRRRFLATAGAGAISAFARPARAADVAKSPRYPDHSQLLVYRDDKGREHPVKTAQDWAIRRTHILAGMQEAMGPLPEKLFGKDAVDPDMQVAERSRGDGFVRLTISYLAEPGDRVPAYLYLPEPSPTKTPNKPQAAMLALHPTSPLGKKVVDGQGPRPNRAYALELAQRGYVVLAPDYPPFGDYHYDFETDRYVSGTMKGIVNHMRGVDLLASLDEVDPERIGVIGHSLGGHNAIFVGVFDQRLKVIVSSCGWTPFHDYYGGDIRGWTSDRYMPRLRDVYGLDPDRVPFDFYETVAALAPRAFFSNSPLGDANFAVEGVKKAVRKVRAVFALFDAADKLEVRYPDCQHDFPPEVRREAYAFLDRHLHHVPTRETFLRAKS